MRKYNEIYERCLIIGVERFKMRCWNKSEFNRYKYIFFIVFVDWIIDTGLYISVF